MWCFAQKMGEIRVFCVVVVQKYQVTTMLAILVCITWYSLLRFPRTGFDCEEISSQPHHNDGYCYVSQCLWYQTRPLP